MIKRCIPFLLMMLLIASLLLNVHLCYELREANAEINASWNEHMKTIQQQREWIDKMHESMKGITHD